MPATHLPYRLGGLLCTLVTLGLVLLLPLIGWGQDTPNAIRVGVLHFPPHMILDDGAPPRGFAIDVLEAVAERAGIALQYVVIPQWSETLQALRDKRIDLIPGMGVTDERRQWFAFTVPIEVTPVRLFVRADTTTIDGLDDLGGRSVSVVQDNVGARLMQRHRAQHPDVDLLIHASREEALLALLAGQSDALAYPVNVLRHRARQVGLEDRIKTVGMPLMEIKRALALRLDRSALRTRLDRALQAFLASPGYQTIFTKWYGRAAPFWTVKRVGLVMGGLLIVTIAVLVIWRYRSVVQLNAQLTTAHQFLQSTLDALSTHIAILDETGTVVAVNAAWHRLTEANGFPSASLGVGADYLASGARTADRWSEVEQGLRDVMAGQSDYFACEYACHRPEEEPRWFMVRCTSFASAAGLRVVMAHEDMTTQKQAEQAVRESEERFRQITETIQEFFWMSDPHSFEHLYVSPAYETIWERSCESLYDDPLSWLEAIHPEDREVAHATLEVLHGGKPSDVEYRILVPEGTIRWIRDRGFPILDRTGQVYRRIGAAEDITQRKHIEDSLRESEQRFRNLIEGSIQGILIHRDGQPLFVNQAFADMFGFVQPQDILTNLDTADLIAPHEQLRLRQMRDDRLSGKEVPYHYEYQGLRKDGAYVWLESRVRVIDWEGAPAVQSTVVDITERKRAEAMLQQWGDIFQHANFGIVVGNAGSETLDLMNPAFAHMHGYTVAELTGMPVTAVFAPAVRLGVPHYLCETRTKGHQTYESQHVRKDGGVFPVLIDATAVLDHDGRERLRIVYVQDITVLSQAETALRDSEERFRRLIENSPSAIFLKDRDGMFRLVNKRFEEWYGIAGQDVLGKTSYDVFPPAYAAQYVAQDQAVLATGTMMEQELDVPGADGTLYRMLVTKYAVFDERGDPIGVGTINTDLTERKRVEDERKHLEAQLQQAQKMEAIGTLAGGIAHDFNNVLSAILMNTELAQALLQADSPIQDNLQNVLLAARRAKDLVHRILTFSRQVETQPQPVRLTSVIQEILTLLRASLPATIEIRQSLPTEGDTIFADPAQLHQIVLNLCVNAEHAMRETGGILEFHVYRVELDDVLTRSHAELAPGPHVQLTIRDSGYGMSPEVMARVFEPFFTTKGVGEGSGMGLAMVHGIVASHDGAITVESSPGAGTTFTLYFPCIQESVEDPTTTPDATASGTGRIMVVDDEPMLVSGMKALLSQFGYEVSPYTSSQEALVAFAAQPEHFDLVITDQTMPHMTGEQLARELRQIRRGIPIILCTGFSHVINAESAREQGIDAYCLKPMNAQELTATIQNVLSRDAG